MNYYPWNTQVLSDWLKLELSKRKTLADLADALGISKYVLQEWLLSLASLPLSHITLEQLQALARYHQWTVEQVFEWLGIGSAHQQELQKQHRQELQKSSRRLN